MCPKLNENVRIFMQLIVWNHLEFSISCYEFIFGAPLDFSFNEILQNRLVMIKSVECTQNISDERNSRKVQNCPKFDDFCKSELNPLRKKKQCSISHNLFQARFVLWIFLINIFFWSTSWIENIISLYNNIFIISTSHQMFTSWL